MTRNPLDLDSVRKCKLCINLSRDHVPAEGNPNADLMIIGRDPGRTEVEVRKPFVGPSGEILDYMLDEIGLDRTDVYITNLVKCHTPNNRGPHSEEVGNCTRTWLFDEIKTVDPKVVLFLGKDVHIAMLGNKPYVHLEVHKGKKRTAITAYHPAYILRQGTMTDYIPDVANVIKQCLEDNE